LSDIVLRADEAATTDGPAHDNPQYQAAANAIESAKKRGMGLLQVCRGAAGWWDCGCCAFSETRSEQAGVREGEEEHKPKAPSSRRHVHAPICAR
jgi:hypothetical protein